VLPGVMGALVTAATRPQITQQATCSPGCSMLQLGTQQPTHELLLLLRRRLQWWQRGGGGGGCSCGSGGGGGCAGTG
jgi:hypothetical protein